nr:RNA-directed DNA polymerase, eukaryota, reverse transcriptase zinc-binding domain protein [Tanacetum cinerariifolium]
MQTGSIQVCEVDTHPPASIVLLYHDWLRQPVMVVYFPHDFSVYQLLDLRLYSPGTFRGLTPFLLPYWGVSLPDIESVFCYRSWYPGVTDDVVTNAHSVGIKMVLRIVAIPPSTGNLSIPWTEDRVCVGQHVHERVEVSNDTHESTCSGHFKKSKVPCKGGSILELIDDLVNVGQTMGYDMTGCIKNMEEIIESQGVDEIHR